MGRPGSRRIIGFAVLLSAVGLSSCSGGVYYAMSSAAPSVPVLVSDGIVIDGVVTGDTGWDSISPTTLDTPGPGATAQFKIARHSIPNGAETLNYVDLGVVTDSYATTDKTFLVLGVYSKLSDGTTECPWKIVVQYPPPSTLVGASNKPSPKIVYANNCPNLAAPNGGWNAAGHVYKIPKPGSWLLNTRFSHKASGRWEVEMRIPNIDAISADGIYFPAAGFKLYVNVVVVKNYAFNPQLPWPPSSTMGGANHLCGMPHPEDPTEGWGEGYFSP
jgi:hypothetical protein